MKKLLMILTLFILTGTGGTFLHAQDYLFFTDSDLPTYYDPSWLNSVAPSELLAINGSKFPVSVDTFYDGTNALKLKYKSMTGGDWMAAIAAPGWPGRDASLKDSIEMWIYSPEEIISQNLPYIFVEDLSNQRSTKIPLSHYNGNIPALTWTKISIPLDTLKLNPGSADLTRIKTIFLGQNAADAVTRTIFIDNVKMIGGESVLDHPYIVVVGSSTPAGTGASPMDSAWVNRLRKHVMSIDSTWRVANLAVGGYTTYHIMPTGFTPPSGRPTPRTTNNISYAMEYQPLGIIINLPSNDAANNYPISEQIANYDTLVNFAAQRNVRLFITTTQPRNFSSQTQLDALMAMRDSTWSRYGNKRIDFWTDIALQTGYINPIYNSGDGIHLNNAGHRVIYERAAAVVIPIILPVEFLSFSAFRIRNSVQLEWSTATEVNNKGFEIERKEIEGTYTVIGFRSDKGTTSEKSLYKFIDINSESTTGYVYRLKQIDFDGTFVYSSEVFVSAENPAEYSLNQNYPNPFNPNTVIRYALPQQSDVTLKIYNVLGETISVLVDDTLIAGNYEVLFNATNLPSGVYFYQLSARNGNGTVKEMKKMLLVK